MMDLPDGEKKSEDMCTRFDRMYECDRHRHTHTYQRYIVGKVHCGENPCVLVGRCGERTHIRTSDTLWGKCIVGKICASELVVVGKIHTYVQIIHCGESALWGKSVLPRWSLWGKYTHTYK